MNTRDSACDLIGDTAPRPRRWPVLLLGLFVGAGAIFCLVGIVQGWLRADTLQTWVAESGTLAWATYLLGNVLLAVVWFPRMWRLMAGGLLFGPVVGGALSVIADLIGGLVCYLFARGAGRAAVERWLAGKPQAEQLIQLLAVRRGVSTMALVRVCPLFHYTLGSYVGGLAGVPAWPYMLGTFLGVVPGAVLYPLAGDAMLEPTSPLFLGSVGAIFIVFALSLWFGRRSLEADAARREAP